MGRAFAKCSRYGGMMIYEKIYCETEHFWMWRCVYCGDYIDSVILENRQIQNSIREKSGRNNEEPVYKSYSSTPSV
jgi:hypothetical protein